jgi:hypothetical protein
MLLPTFERSWIRGLKDFDSLYNTTNRKSLSSMRPSLTRFAASATSKPINLRETGASLLPPIP